jgi:excisionase family DNA binding protein
MAQGTPSLVSVVEAGRALGVSLSTVWRLIRRGALPSVRRGGRRSFDRHFRQYGRFQVLGP